MKRKNQVSVYFNDQDYAIISEQFTQSTHRKLSGFLREKALEKSVVQRVHNASLDRVYDTLAEIKTDLQLACDSFERCASEIKEYVGSAKIETELMDLELNRRKLVVQLQKAFDRISKLADQ
jgi:hypothetical protein